MYVPTWERCTNALNYKNAESAKQRVSINIDEIVTCSGTDNLCHSLIFSLQNLFIVQFLITKRVAHVGLVAN